MLSLLLHQQRQRAFQHAHLRGFDVEHEQHVGECAVLVAYAVVLWRRLPANAA